MGEYLLQGLVLLLLGGGGGDDVLFDATLDYAVLFVEEFLELFLRELGEPGSLLLIGLLVHRADLQRHEALGLIFQTSKITHIQTGSQK